MISDEQFTAAMERAVASRGGDWRYPTAQENPGVYTTSGKSPAYSDEHGNPACLIGVAMGKAGMTVPRRDSSASAITVLMYRVSTPVAVAARAAQIHQDEHRPWSEALDIYKEALRIISVMGWDADVIYRANSIYATAARNLGHETSVSRFYGLGILTEPLKEVAASMEKVAESADMTAKAMEVLLKPEPIMTFSWGGDEKPTFSITGLLPTMPNGFGIGGIFTGGGKVTITPLPKPVVVAKKDHELVA